MNKENNMTEWMKLERLEKNDLPLPQYETEYSAGVRSEEHTSELQSH